MNEYKEPLISVIYLEHADVFLTGSIDGDIVEPGEDWGD